MRKVVAGVFVSLDGVMQAPGGPEEDPTHGFKYGGWTFPFWQDDDPVLGEAMGALLGAPYDLLLGRKTYEIFAAYWPYQQDDPIGEAFNRVRKYVATSSDKPLTWNNSTALHNPASDLLQLKQQDGPTLLIQGSSQLIQTLLAEGLIDEFRLMIFPVLLGGGKRLFRDGTRPGTLKLIDSKVAKNGVTINSYKPAGAVRTGSFGHTDPSKAELERRKTIQEEA